MSQHPAPVSSAELTALWRCAFPEISHDNLSHLLVSNEAKKQSQAFIQKHDYPLIGRKISARAGHIFNQAVAMIQQHQCDSVISFASGYSLLGLLIAQHCRQDIQVYDTDLPHILCDRQARMQSLVLSPDVQETLTRCHHLPYDIEKAAAQKQPVSAPFAACKRPVIILEGITYFLQPATRDWFINDLIQWKRACLIIEYWPENALEISLKLKQSFDKGLISDFKEPLESLWTDDLIDQLKSTRHCLDIGIGEAEKLLSSRVKQQHQLRKQEEFYPNRILTASPE